MVPFLENKVHQKLKFSKNVKTVQSSLYQKYIFFLNLLIYIYLQCVSRSSGSTTTLDTLVWVLKQINALNMQLEKMFYGSFLSHWIQWGTPFFGRCVKFEHGIIRFMLQCIKLFKNFPKIWYLKISKKFGKTESYYQLVFRIVKIVLQK